MEKFPSKEKPKEKKEEIHGLESIDQVKNANIRPNLNLQVLVVEVHGDDFNNAYYKVDPETGKLEEITQEDPHIEIYLKSLSMGGIIEDGKYNVKGEEVYKDKYPKIFAAIQKLKENFGAE